MPTKPLDSQKRESGALVRTYVPVLAAILLLLMAAPAAAVDDPPQLVASQPPDGAQENTAPERVSATFDQSLSELSVMQVEIEDECGRRRVDDGDTRVEGNTMSVGVTEDGPGRYIVTYRAEDTEGEVTTGDFTFTVESGPSCDGPPRFVGSRPPAGSTVHRAPDRVYATFSEELDGSSAMQAYACGHRVDNGAIRVAGSELSVGIARKHSGRYTIGYRATAEGETTTGEFSFTAHLGEPCGGGNGHNNHPGDGKNHRRHDRNGHDRNHRPNGRHGPGTEHTSGHEPEEHAESEHPSRHDARDHKNGKHRAGRHADHVRDDGADTDGAGDVSAAGNVPPSGGPEGGTPPPEATTLALALGLSAAVGLLGGQVLRARA
jgi:methionine-rich copper-binding protein CopC